jgi:hypothetical protein
MLTDALRRILTKRQAYRRVFNLEDRDARQVLSDLRRFCGADRAAYRVSPVTRQVDPNATLVAVGRLEVYQRISAFLNINDADLLKLQEHNPDEGKTT